MSADLESLYERDDLDELTPEIRRLLPRSKDDVGQLERLIELGYPDNASALPFVATWLQDANWPIARPISEYFARLGWALMPVVRRVLRGDDELWVYWMLELVVSAFEDDLIGEFRSELAKWAGADDQDAADAAQQLLGRL